jgi:hypothetical protein
LANLGDEDIIAARAGKIERARTRVEIGRALEVPYTVDVPRPIYDVAEALVITYSTPPLGPDEVPIAIQLRNKDIIAARTGKVEGARTRVEIGGELETANGIDVP